MLKISENNKTEKEELNELCDELLIRTTDFVKLAKIDGLASHLEEDLFQICLIIERIMGV